MIFLILILNCANTQHDSFQLKGSWYFKIDGEKAGIRQKWFTAIENFNQLKPVENPSDWDALTGAGYDGWGWYFTDFDYNNDFSKSALHFLSVDDNATIWLNGHKVEHHIGANVAFKFNVTDFIKSGKNHLVVLIEDTGGGGGLNGAVELIPFKNDEDLLKGKYFDYPTPKHVAWSKNAVIYELNPRQFTSDGTFKAIEPRICELKKLGVSIIWLMPIHPIGEKNRKGTLGSYYAVKDYFGVNAEFGTAEDFRRLVKLIHTDSMYVIIDLVANHTAWDNPLIQQHPEWYSRDKNGEIVPPVPDWHDVADLNYENMELWDYMINVMKYWVTEFDIDGYRCDVAEMVPTDFWIRARKELDKIKFVFMLAEAENPELNAFGFDMTYAGKMHRLFNNIARGKKSPKEIDALLNEEYYHYPKGSLRMRFTSNHDENSWNQSAITRMGSAAAKTGAVLTFTLPGNPLIYNGQEIGNEKALAFFDRDPIFWKDSHFRGLYQTLAWLYRKSPALSRGEMIKLASQNDNQIYAFARKDNDEVILVLTNFSDKNFSGEIEMGNFSGAYKEIFSQQKIHFNHKKIEMKLNPWEYRVFRKTN